MCLRATVPLGAAVATATLVKGGFTPLSQSLLIVLAAFALLTATRTDAATLVVLGRRSQLVLVLLGLGTLAILSAAWTVGARGDALRGGVVILSYGVIVVCAADLTLRCGIAPLAFVLASLAIVEAALGLGYEALRLLPDAERIGVSWRPGGTFEYSSALVLLQVGALPLLIGGAHRRDRVARAAALGAALAGAVLGCAGSRLALALGALVLVLVVARPPAADASRATAAVLAALVLIAGVGGHLLLARRAPAGDHSGGALRLLATAALCTVIALAWLPLRRIAGNWRLSLRAAVAGAAVIGVLAVSIGLLAGAGAGGAAPQGGLTHGRLATFKAAARTWLDRPVLGAGSGAFYVASARHQGSSPVRYAHDLPLELAAELGIPGLLLGILLYAAGAVTLWRARGTEALWLLGPMVATFLIFNLLDWEWHLSGLGAAWALAAGGLVGAAITADAGPGAGSRPRPRPRPRPS